MEQEDQILLDELKQGKSAAYGVIFHKYYKSLAAKAYFMLEDEMEAEDLVQNLFVNIMQKQQCLTITSSLKGYLFRSVHNLCLIQLAKQKKSAKSLAHYPPIAAEEDEEFHERREIYEANLNLAFAELPPKRLEAFKLVYLEDKRYKQVAEEMSISVNSLKTHLKLAVKTLQKKLIAFK